MALTQDDLAQIVEAVNEVLARRLEEVFGAIEQLREEFSQTVTVLDGNDHALIAEMQRVKGSVPAEVIAEAGEAWSRFVTREAEHLGLRVGVVAAKKVIQ